MIFLFPLDGADGGTYPLTITNDDGHTEVCQVTVADTTAKGKKPNYTTEEGLYVGDDLARVTELYGTDYTENGSELIYTKGKTCLSLILNDGAVISMEYRMAT
jgi:hypothetical protein